MSDIVEDLKDLQKQAETEKSHYYVVGCCRRAIFEIEHQRREIIHLKELAAGYSRMARS